MIKLYKKDGGRLLYWQTWDDDGKRVMHWGTVGEEGETQAVRSGMFRDAEKTVAEEAARRRQDGYAEIDEDDLQIVVIQYRTETRGSGADLERRHEIQDLLDDRLGWTGLGHCDGGAIGGDAMEICCLVVDAGVAAPVIVQALREAGRLDGAVVAREGEDGLDVLYRNDGNDPTTV